MLPTPKVHVFSLSVPFWEYVRVCVCMVLENETTERELTVSPPEDENLWVLLIKTDS